MSTAPSKPKVHTLVHQLAEVQTLDAPARTAGKAVRGAIPRGTLKDVLSGVPLGHALHPVLTDVVTGTWTSATLLDLVGGDDAGPAAERLIAIGIVAALPTAVSGSNDWADTEPADPEVRRVGAVHAVLNVAALGLYGASLAARRADRRGLGRLLGIAGAGVLSAGGHLGGHLSLATGVGVNQNTWESAVPEWTDAIADADVREGELVHRLVGGVDVLLTRRNGTLHALADRCGHRGGSLHEGELVDGCVQCPLHGSRFVLEDGSVRRGPSAYPQPVFEARVREGRVELRREAGRA